MINTLKQPRAMCSDTDCGASVVWQRERASLNVRVHTWAEQLDIYLVYPMYIPCIYHAYTDFILCLPCRQISKAVWAQ